LATWEGSVARHDNVVISVKRETTPERGKGGDNASWADADLTGPKINKNHVVDSVAIIGW
jgi:hypothetical protein